MFVPLRQILSFVCFRTFNFTGWCLLGLFHQAVNQYHDRIAGKETEDAINVRSQRNPNLPDSITVDRFLEIVAGKESNSSSKDSVHVTF